MTSRVSRGTSLASVSFQMCPLAIQQVHEGMVGHRKDPIYDIYVNLLHRRFLSTAMRCFCDDGQLSLIIR